MLLRRPRLCPGWNEFRAFMKDLDQMAATAADRQRVCDRMSRELETAKEAVRLLGMSDRT